ncbi:hypothetical protein RH915_03460 [Serpentinicella sp. ANB-PHB4]|uniref:hypothetical protein n=1 Tax=Serpentinicella sp. ANB-PHB4 TaxID=3074076 RepID=UPI00285BB097|nr:hypothetical protein [Serpentinicella sp. ANB-PHB4]MDR5658541.1 hypothetical protein [Serpentinicella sp. ANB-PHB4]
MEVKRNVEGFDTSDLAWDAYKIMYKSDCDETMSLCKIFDLSKPDIKAGRKEAFIKSEIKGITKENNKNISVSGDIIFNFSGKDSKNGQGRYDNFRKYIKKIEDEEEKEEYLNKLEICHRMHYSIENCSLMVKQGKLQIAKQSIGNDRGDTFIWALDEYYKGKNELVLNHSTQENCLILKEALKCFEYKKSPSESIYQYCEMFYNIYDKELVDALIYSGSKAINSARRVQEYIELALAFWGMRSKFYYQKKQTIL